MYLKGMWLICGGNHLCHLEIPPYAVKQADLQKSMWSSDSCMLCPDDSGFVDQEKLHQATLDTLVTFINRLLSNYTEICSSTTFKWNSSSETYIWNFYHNFAEADPKKLSPEFMFVSAVSANGGLKEDKRAVDLVIWGIWVNKAADNGSCCFQEVGLSVLWYVILSLVVEALHEQGGIFTAHLWLLSQRCFHQSSGGNAVFAECSVISGTSLHCATEHSSERRLPFAAWCSDKVSQSSASNWNEWAPERSGAMSHSVWKGQKEAHSRWIHRAQRVYLNSHLIL